MKRFAKTALCALSAAVLLTSCGQGSGGNKSAADPADNRFEMPQVPAMISGEEEALDYIVSHYWDNFYSEARPGDRDTALVRGFGEKAFREILGQYALLLRTVPTQKALKSCEAFLQSTEKAQIEAGEGTLWKKVTDAYALVMGDPNSPYRNEEFCIPLYQKIASSPLSSESEKADADATLPLLRLNRLGEKANDFSYTMRNGRTGHLYGIDARYTIIFFSNPGCPNCREVMESLEQFPGIDALIEGKYLAVANIYPDEDLSEWIKYSESYPKNWISAYDHLQAIYGTPLYNIRAIPSVYLLDGEKRVLLKDVPTEYLLQYMQMIFLSQATD